MRDPTRGGVATSLNELARDSGQGLVLWEESIPTRDPVLGAAAYGRLLAGSSRQLRCSILTRAMLSPCTPSRTLHNQ
jgi:AIR synthase related protein